MDARPPQADGGMLKFWGHVHNGGRTPVSYAQVQVISFDAEDKLLGINTGFAQGEVLAPGASARFDISAVGLGTPARHEYLVTGLVR